MSCTLVLVLVLSMLELIMLLVLVGLVQAMANSMSTELFSLVLKVQKATYCSVSGLGVILAAYKG